ncbi:hypothetical protein O1611_g4241 [Lasiodiplodia mahajangana]|uniref:Uncharacterized protein n=1 Tax=Lasiodiplodia mahajangana TaxID=1108764 RepID=A0ACC2JPR6_9PEZI|nr:hypothetical protein O1611_g4241 [Lasiodiplodia mahajangana]
MTIINSSKMMGEDEANSKQHKAYTLLIELLSYQFAFPVQWIDTQRELLLSESGVQRIIEIGPANVLASMAKKAAKKLVGESDAARSFEREYLHIDSLDDARKIYYEYDSSSSYAPDPNASDDTIPSAPSPPTAPETHLAPVPISEAPPVTAPSLPTAPLAIVDREFTPIEVIITLVAQKLRCAFDQIDSKESIQSLSKGKSTLQNELIGDLAAEFGDVLPDGSEGSALEALAESLSSGFSGKPGKSLKQLLDRFLSSKMPGGFGQTELATYLSSRWGLGSNSQLAVQCFCVTIEPSSRLPDVSQVHKFLDKAVAQYTKHAGIALPTQATSEISQTNQNTAVQVDKSELDALKNEHNHVLWKQLQVLAQHLGVNIKPNESTDPKETNGPQQQLDQVYAEFGDDYISRIQGIFDSKKERRYSSWWNWVREDVARLLQHDNSPLSEQRLQALMNRWTPELENMLRHYSQNRQERNMAGDLLKLKPATPRASSSVFRFSETPKAPRTFVDDKGHIQYTENPRVGLSGTEISQASYYDFVSSADRGIHGRGFVSCLRRGDEGWQYDNELTNTYHNALLVGTTTGISYAGKTALVTGAGPGSIGIEVVRGLLSGGARVIVTTSRSPAAVGPTMADIYKQIGACNSELILLPFNAASKKDVEDLIAYIYNDDGQGLGLDIDFVVPFAAIPEPGREIDALDSLSELAHRAMLTNVLRMLGCIKQEKQKRSYVGRPTTVILPLSPNHGDFGGDGLYSESKISLETLFNRYRSESWSNYLSIIGAVIGWTRGTGLMSANNIVAEGIEKLGFMTFSAEEMAFNLLALFSPSIINHSALEPVYADLSGGLMGFQKLKDHIISTRKAIKTKQQERQAICAERERQQEVLRGPKISTGHSQKKSSPQRKRSNILQQFPKLSSHKDMTAGLESLVGMVDLSRTIVVVGCSELGPWGSLRTRWQMESQGKLGLDGLTEMAWAMGLVEHNHSDLVDGKPYVGWVDTESKKPVEEDEFEARYGDYIMKHSGIRTMEPESLDGYDPLKKEVLQEVVIDEDLPVFNTSESLARSFKLRHGDKVDISPRDTDLESWSVVVKRGATFFVPKATNGHQSVAGQLPKGWNASTYGVPEDIISQVDPVTLYVLCCVSEAMFSAGIEDPFELYKHVHASEIGNFIGSGAGGLKSTREMYRHRYRDTPVQGDILQETFLNSMAAWTNMLLFGAAGPIRTPTGTNRLTWHARASDPEGSRSP